MPCCDTVQILLNYPRFNDVSGQYFHRLDNIFTQQCCIDFEQKKNYKEEPHRTQDQFVNKEYTYAISVILSSGRTDSV